MKSFTCYDCHATFNRGRGRPPTDPTRIICESCRNGNAKHKQTIKARKAPTATKLSISIKKISADMPIAPSVKQPIVEDINEYLLPEWDDVAPKKKPIHGATAAAVTSPCPVCSFAYADGGYCSSCGWTKPINRLPHGTASGKVRSK